MKIKQTKTIFMLVLSLSLSCFGCSKKDNPVSATQKNTEQVTPTPLQEKVLMVVTSNDKLKDGGPAGYFLPEAIDFYRVLVLNNGYGIDVVSPKGGKAPMYDRNYFVTEFNAFLD